MRVGRGPRGGTAEGGVLCTSIAESIDFPVGRALEVGDDIENVEVGEHAAAGLEGVSTQTVVQLPRTRGERLRLVAVRSAFEQR